LENDSGQGKRNDDGEKNTGAEKRGAPHPFIQHQSQDQGDDHDAGQKHQRKHSRIAQRIQKVGVGEHLDVVPDADDDRFRVKTEIVLREAEIKGTEQGVPHVENHKKKTRQQKRIARNLLFQVKGKIFFHANSSAV
jgi:uncharacterized protein (DUF2249 family)